MLRLLLNDHLFVDTCSDYLSKLKSGGKSTKIQPCITGWLMTIQSMKQLWLDLFQNYGQKFLLTSRFNQDAIENLFARIRGRGGFRDNPSAMEFRAAFRQIIAQELFETKSSNTNCEVDFDSILLQVQKMSEHSELQNESASNIHVQEESVGNPSVTDLNISAYMGGYLLRKYPPNSCSICTNDLILSASPNVTDSSYTFLGHKAYSQNCLLIQPSKRVIDFVERLEKVFNCSFESVAHMHGVLRRLAHLVADDCDDLICCEQDACRTRGIKIGHLYLKIRLFHALKTWNRKKLSSKSGKRNRKYLKLANM